jgi:nucleoid DNA-binding protein
MASLTDISLRTAAKIGMHADEVQPYLEAMLAIVEEAQRRGEDIELMTFGTLRVEAQQRTFHPHASLLPPDVEEEL